MMRSRILLGALCGALLVPALASTARAAVMSVAAGSEPLSLLTTTPLADGRYETTWNDSGTGATLDVSGPADSTVSVNGGDAVLTPPQALQSASIANANLPVHIWYNYLQINNFCTGDKHVCMYASSDQYSNQEIPGNWYLTQHITGTVFPKVQFNTLGGLADNRFPGESGDSGPLNYEPNGTWSNPSSTSIGWNFSFVGLGFGFSTALGSNSHESPIWPTCSACPAFGSQWSGLSGVSQGLSSAYGIHLGPGQNAYDALYVGLQG